MSITQDQAAEIIKLLSSMDRDISILVAIASLTFGFFVGVGISNLFGKD